MSISKNDGSISKSFDCPGWASDLESLFHWALEVFNLTQTMNDKLSSKKFNDEAIPFVYGALWMNCIGTYVSIARLCQIGHAFDGFRLGRSLSENAIFLRFMLTDPPILVRQFADHSKFLELKFKEGAKNVSFMRRKRTVKRLDKSIRRHMSDFQNQLAPFLKNRSGFNKTWAGMPLKQVAESPSITWHKKEIKDLYFTHYAKFCHFSHPNWREVGSIVDYSRRRFHQYASKENVGECLFLSTTVMLQICRITNRGFRLGFSGELKRLRHIRSKT